MDKLYCSTIAYEHLSIIIIVLLREVTKAMQHAPLHARVKTVANAAKNTQWSMKFVPRAMRLVAQR